ncbi:MAG: AAA family ATPase [Planctomycetes bacterium]|nr:AAA family ATPase [Planctomycetota bacterium]
MEMVLLGALLRDSKNLAIVAGNLTAEDFFSPRHRALFSLMLELEEESTGSADPVTVANAIGERDLESQCGNRNFLVQLMDAVPSTSFLENHVKGVQRAARRRRLQSILQNGLHSLNEESFPVDQVCRQVDDSLLDLMSNHGSQAVCMAADMDKDYRARIAAREGLDKPQGIVRTPLSALNYRLKGGGFSPGHLIVIAARPGMGKTALAFDLISAASTEGTTLFFSLEMPGDDLLQRWYAREAGAAGGAIGGAYGAEVPPVLQRTEMASRKLKMRKLFICDDFQVDLARIRAESLTLQRKGGLHLVVVDYLQLVTPAKKTRAKDRQEEVAEMSRGFKGLAKELGCPVVILAQLNRKAEERPDKRPRLSDLRESGAIEQDADCVLLLYRPNYYFPEENSLDEVIVAKNRQGEPGTVYAEFKKEQMRWDNRQEVFA